MQTLGIIKNVLRSAARRRAYAPIFKAAFTAPARIRRVLLVLPAPRVLQTIRAAPVLPVLSRRRRLQNIPIISSMSACRRWSGPPRSKTIPALPIQENRWAPPTCAFLAAVFTEMTTRSLQSAIWTIFLARTAAKIAPEPIRSHQFTRAIICWNVRAVL